MKKFFQNILERTIAIYISSIGLIIMAAILAIFLRYNKQYLWFAPVVIAFILILLSTIILIITIIKKKRAIKQVITKQPIQQIEIKDIELMSLAKAVEILIDVGQQKQITKGIGYDIEMQNDADGYYEPFGKLIAKHVDIYGKRASSSFDEWEIISEDMIFMGAFINLCSELYLNKQLLFNNLAIRKIDLDKAIQEIMSPDRPFDWLSYEVK